MKLKVTVIALTTLFSVVLKSQNFVIGHNNIPYANSHWNETHSSAVILNNSIYNTFTGWQTGFAAFNIKKTNLNGNVVFWKEDSASTSASPSKLIVGNNRLYYICKNQLTVLDTNLALKYISTYTTAIPNNNWYFNDGLIAQNGDLVLVGASANYSGNTYSNIQALVVRINATTGNLIYSKTFTNTTPCTATSIVENAVNNSLFISGRVISNGYTTFLLNISNDNLGTLNSSKYFTPTNAAFKNIEVKKMIIKNASLYLFGQDSAAKLVVTKTNLNLTATFQTQYFTNFIFEDVIKSTINNNFYVTGYGPRTYTSVPLSILQLDTLLSVTKSIVYPQILNKYDSLSNFNLDYYNGLNGAYSNFGASIFEKNNYIYTLSNKSNINSAYGMGNTNQYFTKEATTFASNCVTNFSVNIANYSYNIAPTTFTSNVITASSYTQSSPISNIIPTVAVNCGAVTSIYNNTNQNIPKIYAYNKLIYLQDVEFANSTFEIYTLTGQKVFTTQLHYNQKQIDILNLTTGIYIYKLYYNFEVYSKKIVIE